MGQQRTIFRYCFCLELQNVGFWTELNMLWRSGESTEEWRRRFVRDAWLIDIVERTLQHWAEYPESAEAMLCGGRWFVAPEFVVPEFRPCFEAVPQFDMERIVLRDSELHIENAIESHLSRLEEAFERQYREHAAALQDFYYPVKQNYNWRTYCNWTALHVVGVTYSQIADAQGMESYLDAEQAVKRGVGRFAKRIGLTLKGTQNRAFSMNRCTFPKLQSRASMEQPLGC